MRNKFLYITLCSSSFLMAQAPTPLTELEQTKYKLVMKSMEVAQMQQSIANKNVAEARSDMQNLIIALEKEHPGFTLDLGSGNLIAKPKEKAPEKPAEELVLPPKPGTVKPK